MASHAGCALGGRAQQQIDISILSCVLELADAGRIPDDAGNKERPSRRCMCVAHCSARTGVPLFVDTHTGRNVRSLRRTATSVYTLSASMLADLPACLKLGMYSSASAGFDGFGTNRAPICNRA